jgi:hypothetical protein
MISAKFLVEFYYLQIYIEKEDIKEDIKDDIFFI